MLCGRYIIPPVIGVLLLALMVVHWFSASASSVPAPIQSSPVDGLVNSTTTDAAAWTFVATGDIMLDRHIRSLLSRDGLSAPFQNIQDRLKADLVIGNLEGPMTNNASVATDTHLIFTFDPATAPVLRQVGFTDLSLANNHTLNFGQAGLDRTRQVLEAAGLRPVGDPNNRPGFGQSVSVGADQVALIGYHGLASGIESVIADIQTAVAHQQFVIVLAHWGGEYQLGIQPRVQDVAHQLIDAGADLILGSHPHVVEPLEIYQGKFIAYSLGNFLFDQYFSEETLRGLILLGTVSDQTISLEMLTTKLVEGRIVLLDDRGRQHMLDRLAEGSAVEPHVQADIRQGTVTLPRLPDVVH